MTNTQVTIILIFIDNTQLAVGGFINMDMAQAWITAEKAKSYWKNDTQVQLTDYSTSPPTVTTE